MFETITQCQICENNSFTPFFTCTDHSISKETFALVKCTSCGFLITNPRPDLSSIGKYYQSEDYISHKDKGNSLINLIYKKVRNYTLKKKVNIINRVADKGFVLDYGCGTGYFLKACQEQGWQIEGIEPDEGAKQLSQTLLNKKIHSNIHTLTGEFDVITLWHVLEHIHKLNDTLKYLYSALTENGKLIVAVPNYKSYDGLLYGEYWAAFDVPRHLYHFEQKTLKKLADKHNFKVQEIIPMKFDSFYVSMLSEKYKGNRFNLFKPFINGFKSNIYANKTSEYSSLIYILSK